MPGFTDRFGGSAVNPSDVGYLALPFSVNTTLTWPSTGGLNVVARLIDATPAGPGLTLMLPDARESSKGYDTLINNLGADTFTVLDANGGTIGTVAAGGVRYFYLTDVSTLAGVWRSLNIGSLTSTIDAATLAGFGLGAVATSLQTNLVTTTFSGGFTIGPSDRSKVLVWTGGTGTLTLPLLSTLDAGFHIEVRNEGTGILTISPSGGQLIDSSASLALQVTDSFFVHVGPSAWYTVGRGRNTQFSFSLLSKAITGGTTTLTPTEAANVVQKYTGILVSNATIEFPAYVQVYYVSNQTTGAFSLTFKTTGVGTTVVVPQGQNAVLFSDGTNVINSSTTVSGISSLSLSIGAAASPSLNFVGDGTTGLFQPVVSTIGFSVTGVEVARVASSGLRMNLLGTAAVPAWSFVGDPNTGMWSPGADILAWSVGGVEAMRIAATRAVTIAAPSAGNALSITAFSGSAALALTQVGATAAQYISGAAGVGAGIEFAGNGQTIGVTSLFVGQQSDGTVNILQRANSTLSLGTNSLSRVLISGVGNVIANAPSAGATLTLNQVAGSAGLSLAQSLAGTTAEYNLLNTSNTASSDARFFLGVGGALGGDPYSIYNISGVQNWAHGVDNSDSDAYVFAASAALGTTNRLRLAVTGTHSLYGTTSGSFNLNATGVPYGTSVHNNAGAVTGATNQYFCSGSYTPIITNSVNTSAQTSFISYWSRIGNVVTVGLSFQADPVLADTFTAVTVSLPPTQGGNFASTGQARGSLSTTDSGLAGVISSPAYVDSIAGTQTVLCGFTSGTDVTNRTFSGTFVYLVV
jgi:hypothetical protein